MRVFKDGAFYWVCRWDGDWSVASYDATWRDGIGTFWDCGIDSPKREGDFKEIGEEIPPRE